jgi:hypothetical protein
MNMKPWTHLAVAALASFAIAITGPLVADETKAPAPTPVPSPAADASSEPAKTGPAEPFAFADFTWVTGSYAPPTSIFDSKYFTGEVRVDVNYVYDFVHPKDHTIDGSAEIGRAQELQLQQLGLGGDFHWDNVRARFMTQFGGYSQLTPRNDPSPTRGQWNMSDMYRYISEASAGYHIDKMNGINIDAGIFMSYVGLYSYYNFDNWSYHPSYVSANTPWFFQGIRIQLFPSDKLKIEPWIVNGWQAYGMFNESPGVGFQLKWTPTGSVNFVTNNYYGKDTMMNPDRKRWHTDNSIVVKYFDRPDSFLDKAAFSLTVDAGCETGGGVSCTGSSTAPAQNFLGFMAYNRFWFQKDKFGVTIGGGAITNPGRYLVLTPPINGATAATGTPYFTQNPGDSFRAWDYSVTFDYMPKRTITFRAEYVHRGVNVPYFAGAGGVTPDGGNTGSPGSMVPGFNPDLRKYENRLDFALMVRF